MSIDHPTNTPSTPFKERFNSGIVLKIEIVQKHIYPRGARNTCVGWTDSSRDILSVNSRVNSRSVKFNVFGVGGWIRHVYHKLSRQHVECFNLVTRVSGGKIRNPGNEVGVSTRIHYLISHDQSLNDPNLRSKTSSDDLQVHFKLKLFLLKLFLVYKLSKWVCLSRNTLVTEFI